MKPISPTYANEEAYSAYIRYLALKKHFTTDQYDFHKYNGKVKASYETFRTRNDTFYFRKLTKHPDWQNVLLANLLVKPDTWIRDIVEPEGTRIYTEWLKRIESLGYLFQSDLKSLNEDYRENFISHEGQHPYIMTLFLQKKISLETFTILAHLAKIFTYWDEKVVDKFVASDIIRKSRKYKPFLDFEPKRFSDYVKNHFLL